VYIYGFGQPYTNRKRERQAVIATLWSAMSCACKKSWLACGYCFNAHQFLNILRSKCAHATCQLFSLVCTCYCVHIHVHVHSRSCIFKCSELHPLPIWRRTAYQHLLLICTFPRTNVCVQFRITNGTLHPLAVQVPGQNGVERTKQRCSCCTKLCKI
jgi:hypothetical protein